jgi:hypothetical protein
MQRTRQTTMLLLEFVKIPGLLYGVPEVDLGKAIRLLQYIGLDGIRMASP